MHGTPFNLFITRVYSFMADDVFRLIENQI